MIRMECEDLKNAMDQIPVSNLQEGSTLDNIYHKYDQRKKQRKHLLQFGSITVCVAVCAALILTQIAQSNNRTDDSNASAGNKTTSTEYYDYASKIDQTQILDISEMDSQNMTEMAWDMTDPNMLYQHATNVFVGEIVSKDYATCNLDDNGYSPIPYTVGQMKIIKSYKGNTDEKVAFARSGGIVTIQEYDRNAPASISEKVENLQQRTNTETPLFIKAFMYGDTDVECEKKYLFYATYEEKYNRFSLIGFQYGSLEIEADSNDLLQIKNAGTNTYMELSDYEKLYLPSNN
jgi:hypothetical protein